MANDIVPELYEKIHSSFLRRVEQDKRIQRILEKVSEDSAESEDAAYYALYLGEHAGDVLAEYLTEKNLPNGKLYWNIADRTIRPLMTEVHGMVNDIGVRVIESQDRKIGIGLKTSPAPLPKERIADLVNKIVEEFEREEEGKTWEKKVLYGQR